MNEDLQAAIRMVMSDGQSRNAKWIRHKLLEMGVDASVNRISKICSRDGTIEKVGIYSDRAEYRKVRS
ncbi:MAG: hypothetical protein IKN41_04890 [Candidatus Methanomethylophilaceae archaeon]|nr:hypothetical protein [Candidatus Methanomethylophilaceae archaeon]